MIAQFTIFPNKAVTFHPDIKPFQTGKVAVSVDMVIFIRAALIADRSMRVAILIRFRIT